MLKWQIFTAYRKLLVYNKPIYMKFYVIQLNVNNSLYDIKQHKMNYVLTYTCRNLTKNGSKYDPVSIINSYNFIRY